MGNETVRPGSSAWLAETPVVPYSPQPTLAPPPQPLIAGRYALGQPLGRGGHASVWEADDRVSRAAVALKRFHHQGGPWTSRIRREIAALRMLRVPGVVQLLDEGVDDEGAFVVMERVLGRPFPGRESPVPWDHLRPTLVALLETLARIHARGVVHRDIKPGNILVRDDGTPVVLDFGIARWDLGGALTNHGEVLGTPVFLAPEQLQGEPVTPATDLYALGVMLFEALSGALPFDGPSLQAAMYARLFSDAPSLRRHAPDAPQEAVELVARLLARSPEDRPQSADDVLRDLATPAGPRGRGRPWLGPRDIIDSLLDAALHGRSADLTGPPGSGRTRCLAECGQALQAAGRATHWVLASPEPFGSVQEILGPLTSASLADAVDEARRILLGLLRAGAVLLCDDVERIDPLSAELLDALRAEGCVLRALDETHPDAARAHAVAPLDARALMGLVDGTERLFHLRSDAAALLLSASSGWAAAVHDTLEAWTRSGVARRVGERVFVDREGIARARNLRWHRGGRAAHRSLTPPPRAELLQLHHAMELAGPNATVPVLCAVLEITPWRIEAMLLQLVTARVARRAEGEVYAALPTPWMDPGRTPEQIRALHARIAAALPAGTPGRLDHLLFAAENEPRAPEALCAEGVSTALRHAERGHLEDGLLALSDVVAALHRLPGESWPTVREFFVTWTELAFADGGPRAMDRLLYELTRVPSAEDLAEIIALTRVGLARLGAATNFEAQVAALPASDDPRLERRRFALWVAAARATSAQAESGVLSQARARANALPDPEFDAELLGWEGRMHYRAGDYASAARAHRAAAERTRWYTRRVENTVAAASACMEMHDHPSAIALADEAKQMAVGVRHPIHEARAEWVARSARLRRGDHLSVDDELLAAVRELGVPEVTMLATMCEAVVAWRAQEFHAAQRIAEESRAIWSARGQRDCADLMAMVAIRAGRAPVPGELDAIAERLFTTRMPRVALQVWAMLRDHEGREREAPPALDTARGEVLALPAGVQLEALTLGEIWRNAPGGGGAS